MSRNANQLHRGISLNAIRCVALGTLLANEMFELGVALPSAKMFAKHVCRCESHVDEPNHNLPSCSYSARHFPRHVTPYDNVKWALDAADLPSILEPVDLDSGDGWRPDGMTACIPVCTCSLLDLGRHGC